MTTPTVNEILMEWLKEKNYAGLVDESDCSCLLENLDECDATLNHCQAAYKWFCEDCSEKCTTEDSLFMYSYENRDFCLKNIPQPVLVESVVERKLLNDR